MPNNKNLFLVLSSDAFEITGTKEKPFELREISEWLMSRLFNKDGSTRIYETVTIQSGYKKNAPRKIFIYKALEFSRKPKDYVFSNGLKFHLPEGGCIIHLGKQVESVGKQYLNND